MHGLHNGDRNFSYFIREQMEAAVYRNYLRTGFQIIVYNLLNQLFQSEIYCYLAIITDTTSYIRIVVGHCKKLLH